MANITNFLKELRRRNVFKVGAAYIIVAWLLMQLTEIAAPALRLPEWTLSLITYLLIIGFPLALLFTWAFELTPEGLKPTHRVELDESITSITGRKIDLAIIALLLIAVILLVLENYVWVDEAPPPVVTTTIATKTEEKVEPVVVADRKSVAVLPFANRSKSEDDAFFVDGIHDDILTQLAKIASLKVISRTSVMRYRNTEKSMKDIGDELDVATLLEGGVQRAGNQVRINVQLIDAETDEHLWAEVYDRELTAANIFAIQTEIATAIANALLATLSPEEQERLAVVPTENLAAYESYMLGKQRMAKRTSEGLAEAVNYFKKAIDLDPTFALAYVGLSDTYILQIGYSGLHQVEMQAKSEAAINKALALDDKLGEAYTSLGLLNWNREDFAGAEAAFKKALELNPNYASAYHWYAGVMRDSGREKEAWVMTQKALTLDPLSIIINANIGNIHTRFGRYDEAIKKYEKVIEIDPTVPLGYNLKADVYRFSYGQLYESVPLIRKIISLEPNNPNWYAYLGDHYLDLGDDREAKCWFDHAIKLAPENFYANQSMAHFHAYHNEYGQTLPYAKQAQKIDADDRTALRVLRDLDLRAGSYDKARSRYEMVYPALLNEDAPRMNRYNYGEAIDVAYVLLKTGEQERADLLLDRALAYIHNTGMYRLGKYSGYGIADVQVYALRGEKQQALTALRQAIDEGWRDTWWYYLERDPNLELIRNEPEFQAIVTEIKADMAGQLVRVKEMEKEEDVCINP